MKFVKTEDLKTGMRIARPIYNKKGVLLYERDSKLTDQSIGSIRNFGLIGIFVLEPAEPVPPMSEDDIEFERFQTVNVYALEEELRAVVAMKRTRKIDVIVGNINKSYGHLTHKINFIQNLRSNEDFVYKHSLNVAILAAMICHKMNLSPSDTNEILLAALTHDIGKLSVPKTVFNETPSEADRLFEIAQTAGFDLLETIFASNAGIKRMCAQTQKILAEFKEGILPDESKMKIATGTRVLLVAETYDSMTAMSTVMEPASEVQVIKYLTSNPKLFHPKAVEALTESINILSQGTSVELNSGEKALVLSVNPRDILRPMVLVFSSNQMIDLSDKRLNGDLEIVDIMKTMDNRYVMDEDSIKKFIPQQ